MVLSTRILILFTYLFFPVIGYSADLFVVDHVKDCIYKYSPDGNRSVFAVGFSSPHGLAFDSSGNLFVTDVDVGKIYKYDPTGAKSEFASGLHTPVALAFDKGGNLFVACQSWGYLGYSTIEKFAPNGSQSTFVSKEYDDPTGLAFDSNGNLFESAVQGSNNSWIYKYTPNGTVSTFATYASGLRGAGGIAFDSNGNLFESDFFSGSINKFSPTGVRTTFASGLDGPNYVTFDTNGDFYVGVQNSHCIVKYTSNGIPTTFASGVDAMGLAFAPIPEPSTIALLGMSALGFIVSALQRRKATMADLQRIG